MENRLRRKVWDAPPTNQLWNSFRSVGLVDLISFKNAVNGTMFKDYFINHSPEDQKKRIELLTLHLPAYDLQEYMTNKKGRQIFWSVA